MEISSAVPLNHRPNGSRNGGTLLVPGCASPCGAGAPARIPIGQAGKTAPKNLVTNGSPPRGRTLTHHTIKSKCYIWSTHGGSRISLRKGLQGAAGRPHARLVHAPGRPLHARIPRSS